jgi:hypothetical protein
LTRRNGIAAGTTDLRLEVARGATIEGRIVGPDGLPVPGCSVYAIIDGDHQGNYLADGEGRFSLPCPEGRAADLVAWPTAGAPGSTIMVIDENGGWDQSYNATLNGVLPGTPDIVLRLPKLP